MPRNRLRSPTKWCRIMVAFLGEPQARDSKEKILKAVAPAVGKGQAFVQASDCLTCHTFGSSTPELDAIVAYLHHLR